MTFDFKDKNIIITGGSRGIGKAAAKLFALAGANLIIIYKSNEEAAEQTYNELGSGKNSIYQLDISDGIAISHFFEWYEEKYITLDVIVNNAGILLEDKILETDFSKWQENWLQTLNTNLLGIANMCWFASNLMAKQNSGKIINISSRGAFRGDPDNIAYVASKAGLNAMSQSLAIALAPNNVSIHIIAPGYVATEMTEEVLNSQEGELIKKQSPFNRVASPEEVATLIAVYASEGLEFTSAGIIDINGASYLRT